MNDLVFVKLPGKYLWNTQQYLLTETRGKGGGLGPWCSPSELRTENHTFSLHRVLLSRLQDLQQHRKIKNL